MRKAHPAESFFNFFTPPEMPSEEEIENGDVDADDLEEMEARQELDLQIGEDIKERVRPHPRLLNSSASDVCLFICDACRSSPVLWTTSPARHSSTRIWMMTRMRSLKRTKMRTMRTPLTRYVRPLPPRAVQHLILTKSRD